MRQATTTSAVPHHGRPGTVSASTAVAAGSAELLASLLHGSDSAGGAAIALATRGVHGWDEVTYAMLDRRSEQARAWLTSRGIRAGDRVGLLGDSGGNWAAGLVGILRGGAIAVPLDPILTPDELATLLARAPLAAILVSRRLAATIESVPGRMTDGLPVLALEDIPTCGERGGCDVPRRGDDLAILVWTAGTTGDPKGVCLSYANLDYVITHSVAKSGATSDDSWLSVLSLNHMLELSCGLLSCLRTGASMAFPRSHMPAEIVNAMNERRVTRMMVVPMLLRFLYPALAGAPEVRGRLRSLFCGGAPLGPALLASYAALPVPVFEGYGLTELAPVVSMNSAADNRTGSVGRPLPGTEVRVVAGEILVRSPGVMASYWDDVESTLTAIDSEGWFHTGDLGEIDADGYLYITGRAKNLVVLQSGKKVSPEEVEAALSRSELIAEVCVVALAGGSASGAGDGSESVCAVVLPAAALRTRWAGDDDGLAVAVEAEVRRCSQVLSGYKRPTVVEVEVNPLPKTAKMSLRRAEVLRMVVARRSALR